MLLAMSDTGYYKSRAGKTNPTRLLEHVGIEMFLLGMYRLLPVLSGAKSSSIKLEKPNSTILDCFLETVQDWFKDTVI